MLSYFYSFAKITFAYYFFANGWNSSVFSWRTKSCPRGKPWHGGRAWSFGRLKGFNFKSLTPLRSAGSCAVYVHLNLDSPINYLNLNSPPNLLVPYLYQKIAPQAKNIPPTAHCATSEHIQKPSLIPNEFTLFLNTSVHVLNKSVHGSG